MGKNSNTHPDCITRETKAVGEVATCALNVLVCQDDDGAFIAQGIEIDYVATGNSADEARARFQEGFVRTIKRYLHSGRSFAGLFKSAAPAEARERFYSTQLDQDAFFCVVERIDTQHIPAGVPVPRNLAFVSSLQTA